MFRNRARHLVAACAALLLSALLGLPAIGDTEPSSSPPKTPPLLFAPPLFASAGQAQDVSAVVTGVPDAVRLVVGDRSFDMHADGDSLFTGTIPSDLVVSELNYSVTAAYGDVVNTSEGARLVVLDEIHPSVPRILAEAGKPLVDIGLVQSDEDVRRVGLGAEQREHLAERVEREFAGAAGAVREARELDLVAGRHAHTA